MENATKKCFCCSKDIPANTTKCPYCGAEIPTRTNIAAYNANLKITKASLISGGIVGFIACIMFSSIDPHGYLALLGIVIGIIATFLIGFILTSLTQKKMQEESQMLKGKYVFSNKYGTGVIEDYDDGEIAVRFLKVRARFPYQISFKIGALRFASAEEENMFRENIGNRKKEAAVTSPQNPMPISAENDTKTACPKLRPAISVDTHKDFLNKVFGCSHKGYYKTTWPYHGNSDLVVWMVRFHSADHDWKNELLEENGVLVARETYIGHNDTWGGKSLTVGNIVGKMRVVVGIEDGFQRKYHIYGVFKLGVESTGKCRIWKKIPDDVACKMVPEIFE